MSDLLTETEREEFYAEALNVILRHIRPGTGSDPTIRRLEEIVDALLRDVDAGRRIAASA